MNNSGNWQAVAVVVGVQTLLMPVNTIYEIIRPAAYTPIQGVQPWFLGLASTRGNVIAVSDLGLFLFAQTGHSYESSRLILIKSADDIFAFRVDEILGLRKYAANQLSGEIDEVLPALKSYVNEVVQDSGNVLPVIDPELIVNSKRFLNIKNDEVKR